LNQTMSCLTLRDLQANWNGLLAEEEQQRQAEHLAGCPQCRQFEARLREIWSLLSLVSRGKAREVTSACLTESELVGYLYGRMGQEETAKVHSHLVDCRHCLEQMAAVLTGERQPIPAVGEEWQRALARAENLVPEAPTRQGWKLSGLTLRSQWAMASVATVAVLAAVFAWHQTQHGVDVEPQPGPERALTTSSPPKSSGEEAAPLAVVPQEKPTAVTKPLRLRAPARLVPPSPNLIFPQEGQRVARSDLAFRWQSVGKVGFYELTLLNRKGDVIWEAKVKGLSIRLPAEVLLQPGEPYFAWVIAHRDGESPLRSPSVAFEVLPPDKTR
jgi:predicted anti-sigma-YlaC factor YlaD